MSVSLFFLPPSLLQWSLPFNVPLDASFQFLLSLLSVHAIYIPVWITPRFMSSFWGSRPDFEISNVLADLDTSQTFLNSEHLQRNSFSDLPKAKETFTFPTLVSDVLVFLIVQTTNWVWVRRRHRSSRCFFHNSRIYFFPFP